jgi:hypothetical protein
MQLEFIATLGHLLFIVDKVAAKSPTLHMNYPMDEDERLSSKGIKKQNTGHVRHPT